MGDFNGHNPLWGSKTTTDKGKKLEDFICQEGLCIFNDGTDTYLHPGNGSYSAIDLTGTDRVGLSPTVECKLSSIMGQ
jgi:hypothetical protein